MRFFPKRSLTDSLLKLIENKKTSDRIILRSLFFVAVFSLIFVAYSFSLDYSHNTPARGGVLKEGILGIPRFVNPALAITRADLDTVALLYSGLLKIDTAGQLVPDLAESVTVSEDGKTYTIVMRKDRRFHDNTPITALDAIYTYKMIQDPNLKSPLAGNFADVVITEVNEYEFTVTLGEAYSPFIENFTTGIMPRHIWSNLPIEQLPFSQHNTEPVGSGNFSIKQVNRDAAGLISSYILEPASSAATAPNLSSVELYFYQNDTALKNAFVNKEINATAYLPLSEISQLDNEHHVITVPLPRLFGIFFNQNRSAALRDTDARAALSTAIDRQKLIDEVLFGYGVPITKPTLSSATGLESEGINPPTDISAIEEASRILEQGGWIKNEAGFWEKKIDQSTETLSLTIRTTNNELFDRTATAVANTWRQLGVEVQIEQYEQSDLVQAVIRPRDFQGLLFGIDMNRSEDLYPFWHSSQKDDPGLNISLYTNISIDRLLEKTRNTQDQTERSALLSQISEAIAKENPAVFLFAPSLTYAIDSTIVTSPVKNISRPSDRFMNVAGWYAKTEMLWPIFQNDNIVNELN